ncbi:aminopeptidase P N-terminal domain-containing protein [Pseudoramibacter sp.]|jgi:Xaa-Pro aminopeptidase|uniref:aminopeptidase P N-terminal domain-containing protein n=1 Tax=Pseudoramibacter sp. TaxID=2034862 RepID=UPI0025FC15B5|nr:aminopeptidase P N-terminal domain-containing protein [Pseudoramibacter sp.]MCH4072964.1 aminopeptidase P N-terminal domain-containing protein [Pseudoramibacter sp.]MCH4106735.1 aminopeptidase P N-terminal domain-containing protein [Pseudoramibacter sp.]
MTQALTSKFYQKKREALLQQMPEQSVAIVAAGKEVVKSLDENYRFYVNNNFFYLTGLSEPEGILALIKTQSQSKCTLFIRKPDPFKEKWFGRYMTIEKAHEKSGIEDIRYLEAFEHFIDQCKTLDYFEDDTIPDHQKQDYGFKEKHPLSPWLSQLRLIKSDEEIALIRHAIHITHLGIDQILAHLRPGDYEYQAQNVFESTIFDHGAEETAFDTIAVSGEDAPILHYMTNRKKMRDQTMILFDLGARYHGYCSDISRTFPVGGHFTKEQRALYEAVLQAQEKIIPYYQSGRNMKEVQEISKKWLGYYGSETGLFDPNKTIDDYYYHGIGHSLGLDTHDLCGENRRIDLQPGMVITCEPGLYMADRGMGVRIEDDILITEEGPVVLSKEIPKKVDEIESMMD